MLFYVEDTPEDPAYLSNKTTLFTIWYYQLDVEGVVISDDDTLCLHYFVTLCTVSFRVGANSPNR